MLTSAQVKLHFLSLIKVIKTKNVINCAGLWGDEIEKLKNSSTSENERISKSDFNIQPKKGQFLVYEKIPSGVIPEEIIVPVYDEVKQTKVKKSSIFLFRKLSCHQSVNDFYNIDYILGCADMADNVW